MPEGVRQAHQCQLAHDARDQHDDEEDDAEDDLAAEEEDHGGARV